jgi:hypothetical protein
MTRKEQIEKETLKHLREEEMSAIENEIRKIVRKEWDKLGREEFRCRYLDSLSRKDS